MEKIPLICTSREGVKASNKVDYQLVEANSAANSLAALWSMHCVCGCLSLDSGSESLLERDGGRGNFLPSSMHIENFNGHSFSGHSMTGELLRVMVCPPGNAGWDNPQKAAAWQELGFQRA